MKAIKLTGMLAIGILILFSCTKERASVTWNVKEVTPPNPCAKIVEIFKKDNEKESLKMLQNNPELIFFKSELLDNYKCIASNTLKGTLVITFVKRRKDKDIRTRIESYMLVTLDNNGICKLTQLDKPQITKEIM